MGVIGGLARAGGTPSAPAGGVGPLGQLLQFGFGRQQWSVLESAGCVRLWARGFLASRHGGSHAVCPTGPSFEGGIPVGVHWPVWLCALVMWFVANMRRGFVVHALVIEP